MIPTKNITTASKFSTELDNSQTLFDPALWNLSDKMGIRATDKTPALMVK
jgi:hypothetical protein